MPHYVSSHFLKTLTNKAQYYLRFFFNENVTPQCIQRTQPLKNEVKTALELYDKNKILYASLCLLERELARWLALQSGQGVALLASIKHTLKNKNTPTPINP